MYKVSRREILKSGLAVSAGTLLPAGALQTAIANPSTLDETPLAPGVRSPRECLRIDSDWRFALGNADDPEKDFGFGKLAGERTFAKSGSITQSTVEFADASWRVVDLPHDWAVELPIIAAKATVAHGARPLGREYPETSIGWYRKKFDIPASDEGRRIQVQFDGVFRDAMIFVNGHYLTTNFSGDIPLLLDITDWVNFGSSNELALRVDATLGSGWFYEGAGIYRHVWLIKTNPVHLVQWGTYVRAEIKDSMAQINLGSEVRNDSDRAQQIKVVWQLLDSSHHAAGSTESQEFNLPPGEVHVFEGQTTLRDPSLWSVERPNLYQAVATVRRNGDIVDKEQTVFGIRTLRFDSSEGFFLNGNHVKIKGTCCHQDHAGVGAALPDRLQHYRVERLKSMGSNALRTSHNSPTPELIDATDRLGMLVLCETRTMDSSPEGLSQLERMIRRFRNHPSIFMWSLGNEEPEQGTERGARILTTMRALARRLDPTRLCTVAMNGAVGTGISHVVDVQGFNYGEDTIDKFHHDFPNQPCIGTEGNGTAMTRGIYEDNKEAGHVSAYDVMAPPWAATAQKWWSFYDERPFLAGGFAWSGFDYRGEPWPYDWPTVSSQYGIMDLCGFAKDNYFYFKAWWGNDPVLHLFPHWNWPASRQGQEICVWCYSNLETVELFANGQSQGAQSSVRNGHLEWKVKYQPGVIEARGSRDGKVVLTAKRETAGEPARIVLRPDRTEIAANCGDIAIVTVEIQDAQGRCVPIAGNEISLEVSGPGKLLGVGNGDPSSHEPDKADRRRAFNGLAQAIVQAGKEPGAITLRATSPGLESSEISVNARLGASLA